MRGKKEIAEAIESAVYEVNKFYTKTRSVNGSKGVIARSMGKGLSFRERFVNGERVTTEEVEELIQAASLRHNVPAEHIKKVGEWSY